MNKAEVVRFMGYPVRVSAERQRWRDNSSGTFYIVGYKELMLNRSGKRVFKALVVRCIGSVDVPEEYDANDVELITW